MTQPISTSDYRKYPKGPNFLLIVILSGVLLLLFIIGAYFVLGHEAVNLLPRVHPKSTEPTSRLMLPAKGLMDA